MLKNTVQAIIIHILVM